MAAFELYRDAKCEYRWRLKNDDGVIATSGAGAFTSHAGAERNVELVRAAVVGAEIVDLTGE